MKRRHKKWCLKIQEIAFMIAVATIVVITFGGLFLLMWTTSPLWLSYIT